MHAEPHHAARRLAAALGALAGMTTGAVRVLQVAGALSAGARIATIGACASGPIAGLVASALSAALLEGAAGCTLGARFGEAIDRAILLRCRCLSCGHTFNASDPPQH
ncbi:hypothetical protein [Roseateles sp. BYS96W]|uniref:Uncharacterized protein n=1 Tax=Pelomonas nitida TaxID=3299027 RepID=A0ABW7G1V8_9BURK